MKTEMTYTPDTTKNAWAGTGFYTNIGDVVFKEHSGLWFFSDELDGSPVGYCLKTMSFNTTNPGLSEASPEPVSGEQLRFDDCSVQFVRCQGKVVLTINQ